MIAAYIGIALYFFVGLSFYLYEECAFKAENDNHARKD